MSFTSFMEENFSGPASRKMAREELAIKKKLADAALIKSGYDPETLSVIPGSGADVQAQQNNIVLQELKAVQGKLAAQEGDKALLDYAQTGDATYLQNGLNNNPVLKKAWGDRGVQAVANIDFSSDDKLLARNGFNSAEYDTPEKQEILRKNIYKFFDGREWNVGLLNNVVKETGITKRLGEKDSEVFNNNFQQFRDFMAGPRSSANTAEGHKYEVEINDAAEVTGVPANLIAAMMNVESGGNEKAVSSKGAKGLMQLMPETAKELGVKDITNPAQNIMAGAQYLGKMLKKYKGDIKLALAAYNAGPGNVDKYNGIPPFAETYKYVSKVLGNYSNGESYYDVDIKGVREGIARESKGFDDKIAIVQKFVQSKALAQSGSSLEAESRKLDIEEGKVAATLAKANKDSLTSEQKNLKAAATARDELVSEFGGEEQFFNTDFSQPENYNKAYQKANEIMQLGGTKFTADEKKEITNIRGMIALGDPSSRLTASQTGMIDNQLFELKKYLNDNVKGVEAKAAYAVMRNSFRHALYGSVLSPGEIEAFNEAFGTLGQKAGPVLQQFNTMLTQVSSKLESISNLQDPYVSKVLLGADQKKLDSIQNAIQARIDYFNGVTGKKGTRKPLESIFR